MLQHNVVLEVNLNKFKNNIKKIKNYVGDKTLIDALVPCADEWSACASEGCDMKTSFERAAKKAVDGAAATAEHVAHMGRAGTVGDRSIGYPDAGAFALGEIFTKLGELVQ